MRIIQEQEQPEDLVLRFLHLPMLYWNLESKLSLQRRSLKNIWKQADLVITGEGRLDGQTAMGKAPMGVAKLAKKYGLPVIAFAGSVTNDAKECNQNGIDAFFPILCEITTLEEAMKPENAKNNLIDTAEQVFRLLNMKGMP